MATEQAKVHVDDLQRGMFVSRLDRPWTRTPFALQGFYIRDLADIRQLQKYCRYVYVDVVKTTGDVGLTLRRMVSASGSRAGSGAAGRKRAIAIPCRPVQVSHQAHPLPSPVRREAHRARRLYGELDTAMRNLSAQLKTGRPLPLVEIRRNAESLVDSVLRSPDAAAWLARVRDRDAHTYSHSIRASIWAMLFGRHIGLRHQDLVRLATAALLKDVGLTCLPQESVATDRSDPRGELEYRKFVELSAQLLSADTQLDPQVTDIVRAHRERHDGSGYPRGLRGDKIPVLARMCGIVTFYDEVTNPRDARVPVAPSTAVARLYDLRDSAFQEQLVVEFIQAIGLYPTGTQVELSTGEIGVVVEQSYERRLKPKVMVVLDSDKQPLPKARLFDMAADDDAKQKLIDRGSLSVDDKIRIVQSVTPDLYASVDVAAVRDSYLFSRRQLPSLLGRIFRPSRSGSRG
ncbi:HD-GYP domain-containing protein [Microbulbifer sp. TYP-18]|uniref:HD-GYP domain-containing protein n=1 Tax=Microbulbifer sp. TYP-18 TaxID=3230024 RepID=UPI0034C5C6EA